MHTDGLAAKLAARPDADRIRLRLGTEFIAHRDDLWPEGGAPSAEWIRDHVDDILAVLESPLRRDGQDARRLPHRMHWLLWLFADLDCGARRSTGELLLCDERTCQRRHLRITFDCHRTIEILDRIFA